MVADLHPTRQSQTHDLKTDAEPFRAVLVGKKTCELRKVDRDYRTGDRLRLRETYNTGAEMADGAALIYTGRECFVEITHVLRGPVYGLADGWALLSIRAAAQSADALASRPPADRPGPRPPAGGGAAGEPGAGGAGGPAGGREPGADATAPQSAAPDRQPGRSVDRAPAAVDGRAADVGRAAGHNAGNGLAGGEGEGSAAEDRAETAKGLTGLWRLCCPRCESRLGIQESGNGSFCWDCDLWNIQVPRSCP